MERPPRFNQEKKESELKVVEETPYGPVLRREKVDEPELVELNKTQRKGLRDYLSSLGVKLNSIMEEREEAEEAEDESDESDEEPAPTMSRRTFLKGAAAITASAVGGYKLGKFVGETGRREELSKSEDLLPEQDQEVLIEEIEETPIFAAELEGYKALVELSKDEVLFLDENNVPVGKPQKFCDFIIKKKATSSINLNHVQSDGTVEYKLSPGKMNEIGIPEKGVAKEWLDYVQSLNQAKNLDKKIKRRMNVVASFMSAYKEKDEPELVSKIASGEISKNVDIVRYFANKPVKGAEEFSRMEYSQNSIDFRSEPDMRKNRPAVPESVQTELKKLIPGMFAHESKFNAGLVSSSGAAGLAQIKPDVWKEYRGTEDVSLSLIEQIEVVGELMSDNYHYILHFAGDDAIKILKEKYDSEDEFNKNLMVPLLINAYNVGGPMMGRVIKGFVNQISFDDMCSGKDLFLQIADYAKENNKEGFGDYANEAREYVSKVYAMSDVLNKAVE